MAITKVTGKTQPAVQSIAQSIAQPLVKTKSVTEALVEELIDLHTRLSNAEAFTMIKRLDEIKKGLAEHIKDSAADPDKPYVFKTDAGEVEFSACTNGVEVTDREKMIKCLGLDTFKQIAKVGVTDLKTYLSLSEIESFSQKTKGSRSMKSVKPKAD